MENFFKKFLAGCRFENGIPGAMAWIQGSEDPSAKKIWLDVCEDADVAKADSERTESALRQIVAGAKKFGWKAFRTITRDEYEPL